MNFGSSVGFEIFVCALSVVLGLGVFFLFIAEVSAVLGLVLFVVGTALVGFVE